MPKSKHRRKTGGKAAKLRWPPMSPEDFAVLTAEVATRMAMPHELHEEYDALVRLKYTHKATPDDLALFEELTDRYEPTDDQILEAALDLWSIAQDLGNAPR